MAPRPRHLRAGDLVAETLAVPGSSVLPSNTCGSCVIHNSESSHSSCDTGVHLHCWEPLFKMRQDMAGCM